MVSLRSLLLANILFSSHWTVTWGLHLWLEEMEKKRKRENKYLPMRTWVFLTSGQICVLLLLVTFEILGKLRARHQGLKILLSIPFKLKCFVVLLLLIVPLKQLYLLPYLWWWHSQIHTKDFIYNSINMEHLTPWDYYPEQEHTNLHLSLYSLKRFPKGNMTFWAIMARFYSFRIRVCSLEYTL